MGGEGTAKLGEDLGQTAWGKLVSSQDTRDELGGVASVEVVSQAMKLQL